MYLRTAWLWLGVAFEARRKTERAAERKYTRDVELLYPNIDFIVSSKLSDNLRPPAKFLVHIFTHDSAPHLSRYSAITSAPATRLHIFPHDSAITSAPTTQLSHLARDSAIIIAFTGTVAAGSSRRKRANVPRDPVPLRCHLYAITIKAITIYDSAVIQFQFVTYMSIHMSIEHTKHMSIHMSVHMPIHMYMPHVAAGTSSVRATLCRFIC